MKIIIKLYFCWFKMGLFTFGGGYAMLPIIQKEVIEKHKWATEDDITNFYAIGQCTPGIIAVNVATFVGYYQKGVLGGVVATLGVISPSIIIIIIIASVLTSLTQIDIFKFALNGINIAVCALMAKAIIDLWNKSIKNISSIIIFIVILCMAMFTDISTVWLVILSSVFGIIFSKLEVHNHE